MPSYEYRCLDCRKRFDIFMAYKDYGSVTIACRHCGSTNVQRRIGRVRIARSSESRLEDMSDLSSLEGMEDDPRALGRMMRQMSEQVSGEAGEAMGPEFDEVVSRLEAGQDPEQIEQDLPDLGAGEDSMDAGGGLDDF
jgi:putative FmdB family regulatory protein